MCKRPFTPSRMGQRVCSPCCALAFAHSVRAKAERTRRIRERAEAKVRLRRRADLLREAQAAFNAFIRARDAGQPCICCGRTSTGWTRGGEWDAGHYRSRGAAPHLRFEEHNCHRQLKQCNRRTWDVAAYRANLIARIGLAAVEALEADQQARKWSHEDLIAIRDRYRAKAKTLGSAAVEDEGEAKD